MKLIAEDLSSTVNAAYENFQHNLDWEFKPGPEKWTGKQILGHLIDSAHNNIQRFIREAYEEGFRIIYQQDEWVKFQHYDKADIKEVILLWLLLNKQIIRILKNYPQERTSVKSDIGQYKPEIVSNEEIAAGYNEHLNHHLLQIYAVTSGKRSVN